MKPTPLALALALTITTSAVARAADPAAADPAAAEVPMLPEPSVVARPPRSDGSFHVGVVLLTMSGAFMLGGAMAVALPFVLSPNSAGSNEVIAGLVSVPLFAGGLATGIPGAVLVASNYPSGARLPPPRTDRGVVVPLVSMSF